MKFILQRCSRTCSLKTFVVVVALIITIQYLVNLSIYKASHFGNKSTYWSVLRNLSGVYETVTTTVAPPLNLSECPIIPPALQGRVTVNTQIPAWAFIEEENSLLTSGGRYKPRDCISRNRVAIVIPYRDREIHLKLFLQNLHPFLQRQQLDYGIYVVEMVDGVQFNRALLMNVGFNEAMKEYDYQCFIFHDVDLLPEDDRNLYTCPHMPRHMSTAIDKLKYMLPYAQIFGGVSAISTPHFRLINGFSNLYFGWGGEDDDMYKRILYSNLTVIRYSNKVARYKMMVHKHSENNPERFKLLKTVKLRQDSDGLTSLKYEVLELERKPLYTWILVSVNMTEVLNSEPIHKRTEPIKKNQKKIQNPEVNKNSIVNQSAAGRNRHNNIINNSERSKTSTSQRERPKVINYNKSKPQIVDWVPDEYEGTLPDNLTKYQPAMFVMKPVPKQAAPKINRQPFIGQNPLRRPVGVVGNLRSSQQQQQLFLQFRKQQLQQRERSIRSHGLKSRDIHLAHKNEQQRKIQQIQGNKI